MKILLTFLLAALGVVSYGQNAQIYNNRKLNNAFDGIYDQFSQTLSENWFVSRSESSIFLTYCRSCQEIYERSIDSLILLNNTRADSSREYKMKEMREHVKWGEYPSRWRESIFKQRGPDSVSFYSPLGRGFGPSTQEDYQPEDILQIEIRFEPLWSDKQIQKVWSRNDTLKAEILKEPLYKTVISFDDYRAFLPQDYLKARTKRLDYYFERLPYKSKKYKYSIFISTTEKELCTEVILVDKSDPLYFLKHENNLEREKASALIVVAYVLGLEDFKYINQ